MTNPTDHSQAHRARRERTDMSEQVEGEGLREAVERLAEYERAWLWNEATDDTLAGWGYHMGQMLYRLPKDGQTRDMQASIESMLADLRAAFDAAERTWDEGVRHAAAHIGVSPNGSLLDANPYRAAHAPEADGATGEREAAGCDRRGPGGECARDHRPCLDFPGLPTTPPADDATTEGLTDEQRHALTSAIILDNMRGGDKATFALVDEFVAAAATRARAEGAEQALREAAASLGTGPTMRWLYERESCDWWGDRPVRDFLRDRADSIARSAS